MTPEKTMKELRTETKRMMPQRRERKVNWRKHEGQR